MPVAKRMRVSRELDVDRAVALVEKLAHLAHGLARHDHARNLRGALGQRHFHPGQPMAVGGHAAQHLGAVRGGGMEVDAVQVVAGLLVGDRKPGAVDDALEVGRRELEAVRQVALGHRRKVGGRQALQGEARPAGPDHQRAAVGGGLELDLRAVRQLADDLVEGMRGRRGRARLGRTRLHRFGDGEVHVGRRQAEASLLRGDQDIRQDGDRVSPFDHTLHVSQRLQKGCPFDRQFHVLIAVTRGQKSGLDTPFRRPEKAMAERSGTIARRA